MREKRCAGRPRSKRCLTGGDFRCMMPACRGEVLMDVVTLLPEEIEAIKLADLLGLEQEDIAARMGVSRKTAWKDLHSARTKVADAVVNGKILRVDGCEAAGNASCGMRRRRGCQQDDAEANNDKAP
jgi:predicted DNA-binding protein (UPF0251 family)